MSKCTSFLLRLCASLLLGICASGSMAQQRGPISPRPSQPMGQVHTTADRLAWRQRMATRPKPKTGCFAATFPSEQWKETRCATPPKMPHKRPSPLTKWLRLTPDAKVRTLPPGSAVAGNGADIAGIAVGGPINAAEGFFDQTQDIQTVVNVRSPTNQSPGAYALQINVAPFDSTSCSQAQTKTCKGWLQYLFMNDNNGAFAMMEVWLLDFGPTCPGEGSIQQLPDMPQGISWGHSPSNMDCVFDTTTTPLLAAQPVTSLAQLRLRGEAIAGGQDTVTIATPDGKINGIAISDNILKLSSGWNEVEFNVFGYVGGSQANFNSGAAAVVHINIENGTKNAPTIDNAGFTGETNNFNLVPPGCSNAGNPPSIVFEEITLASQSSPACPPAIPAPPPKPQPTPCQQATEAVAIAQTVLAKAQARLSDSTCKGPPSINCIKTVQADQAALTAAIAHKNKVCKP